jgi:hypothetical protein
MKMDTIDLAKRRISAVIEEIDRLRQSEFPYPHPREALDNLDRLFRHQQFVLKKVSPTAPVKLINNACSISLYQLFLYIPVLGFILRSTNVRNAFEAYAPLLRLARNILGSDTKLIVSSEWDYSPFIYQSMTDLPGFVLIGLPAPESANPLLIPLAGHELGHSVWNAEKISGHFQKRIEETILNELTTNRWGEYKNINVHVEKTDLRNGNLFAQSTWEPAFTWALLQSEEIFCDFFGLRIFSESYLYAFSYLISPGSSGQRSLSYPSIKRRVLHLTEAAKKMGIAVPSEFESSFIDETEPAEPSTKLLVSVADTASATIVNDLIQFVMDYANDKNILLRNQKNVTYICQEFGKITPIKEQQTLADIINAGWDCILDKDLWKDVPRIKQEDRSRILKDLMLKSMEVSEIYERLR